MNKTVKSSFAILKQEFRVQFITAGVIFAVFAFSMLCKRYLSSYENELPKLFIIFYAGVFGFTLPWQINTRGHIEPGYCRYNLNLPVHTWQLIILPLLSRLLLVFLFLAFEFGLYGSLYSFSNGRYVNIGSMIYYAKISLFVYLLLQAVAWSKDSMKNLFLWIGIPLVISAFMEPKTLARIFDTDLLPVYCFCSAVLLALAVIGVRNLRKGLIFELPGLKGIPALFDKKKSKKEKTFSSPAQAQFHQEWKRSWHIMPGVVLAAIATVHIIAMKSSIFHFFKDALTIYIVFSITVFIAPLLGFALSGKSFSSAYVDNLPIRSRTLAAVRLKVFCLSYAVSLGIFLLWILYKLFIDGRLFRVIHARNQELLYSPGVLVWILAAFLIWAFVLAFIMAGTVLQKKSLFTIAIILLVQAYFLFPGQIFPKYLKYLYAYIYGLDAYYTRDVLPGYVEFFVFVNILIVGWLRLAWLRKRNVIIKFLALITVCFLVALYTLVCSRNLFLMLLPLILIFPYPLFVMTQEINLKRYEFCGKKIIPSWRLALAAGLIFACFFAYTAWLNGRQRKELEAIVEKCAAANAKNPTFQEVTKMKAEDYVRRNMPFKETLLPELEKHLEECHTIKPVSFNSYKVSEFLNKAVLKMCERKQQEQAMKLTEFLFEFNFRYKRDYPVHCFYPVFCLILRDRWTSAKGLAAIKPVLRKILYRRFAIHKDALDKYLSLLAQSEVPDMFYSFGGKVYYYYYYYKITRGRYLIREEYLNFPQMFFSPLCFCDGINFGKTALTAINGMNYIYDKKSPYLNRKINGRLLNLGVHDYNSTNQLLKSIAAVAMAQYRLKNGREPKSLKQLAPDYLKEGELYLFYNSHFWYGGECYQAFLRPDSVEIVKRYLERGTYED